MKILLTIPTQREYDQILGSFPLLSVNANTKDCRVFGHEISVLLTGAGMVNAAAKTVQGLSGASFDLAIQAGVAGSFHSEYQEGMVVEVIREFLPEFGAEDEDRFIPFSKLGFHGPEQEPQPENGILLNTTRKYPSRMPAVSGVTVNRVTGSENRKLSILNKFDADVETMEGYGFFFACLLCKVPFVSLRGISNRVGRRDRQSWKMKEALEQVGLTLNHYLSNLHP